MKKNNFFFIFFLFPLILKAQYIGFIGGGNLNAIYTKGENTPTNYSSFPMKFGYSAGMALDFTKIFQHPLRITTRFNQFNGVAEGRYGGLGGGSVFHFDYIKQHLTCGLHLLNKKNESRVRSSIGLEYNYLLSEKLTGKLKYADMSGLSYTKFYDETNYKLNQKKTLALIASIGMERNLSPNYYIVPQFTLHLGLKKEFIDISYHSKPKALRFFFELGIFRKIKKV